MNVPTFIAGQHVTDRGLNALVSQIDAIERIVVSGASRVIACETEGPFAEMVETALGQGLRLLPALCAIGGSLLDMRTWPAEARTVPVPVEASAGSFLTLSLANDNPVLCDNAPDRYAQPLDGAVEPRPEALNALRVVPRRLVIGAVRALSEMRPEALAVAQLGKGQVPDPAFIPKCETLSALPALAAAIEGRIAPVRALSAEAEALLSRHSGPFGLAERKLVAIADLSFALDSEAARGSTPPKEFEMIAQKYLARAARLCGHEAVEGDGWAEPLDLLAATLKTLTQTHFTGTDGSIRVPRERIEIQDGKLVSITAHLGTSLGNIIDPRSHKTLTISVAGEGLPRPASALSCHPKRARAALHNRLGVIDADAIEGGFELRIALDKVSADEKLTMDELFAAHLIRITGTFEGPVESAVDELSIRVFGD